jgi:phosphate-selective porin OprO/OprP
LAGIALLFCAQPARPQNPHGGTLPPVPQRASEPLQPDNQVFRLAGAAAPGSFQEQPVLAPADANLPREEGAARLFTEEDVRRIVENYLKEREEMATQSSSGTKFSADWKNGLVWESADKKFRIQVGARFNEDWVAFSEPALLEASPPAGVGVLRNGTFFRRLRLQAKGQMWEQAEFNLEFDFENIETRTTAPGAAPPPISTVAFDHMWWGLKDLPVFGTVRVGNQRVPQSIEAFHDSKWLTFMERTAAFDAFILDFAPGILVSNTYFDQHVTWHNMFHRASGLAPRFAELGTGADFGGGEWAATTRLTLLPIYEDEGRRLLHLGASYQWRRAKFDPDVQADVIEYRARPEIRDSNGFAQESNNNRYIDTGLIEARDAHLLGTELIANFGRVHVQSEYYLVMVRDALVRSGQAVIPLGNPAFQGCYVQVSYFLTGEHQPYDRRFAVPDRPQPITNFYWARIDEGCPRGLGLWEIAARYTFLDLGTIPGGGGTGGGSLSDLNIGLNWWLNSSMKVQWNYIHANRDVPAPNHSGGVDAFGMRFAIDF